VAAAYDAAITNSNDVIALSAYTSHQVTSMLAVSKNRIHFIGMEGGGRKIGSRTLISNTAPGAATDVAMVDLTGSTGCTFRNISFKNNWTVAENLYAVKAWGIQTYFENCDIENLGSAHLSNADAASLALGGNEVIFNNCTIGQDTLLVTSTAGQVVTVTNRGTTATKATRCRFDNCRFQTYTSNTAHVFVRAAATSIDRDLSLNHCEFANTGTYATSGVDLAQAVATATTVAGAVNVAYPAIFHCDNLSAAGATGVFVVSPVLGAAASDCVGVQAS
jgi:hypothetical protein